MPKGLLESEKPTDSTGKENNPEQDYYDIFVSQGIKMASKIAASIKGKASVNIIGNALADIVGRVETEGAKNGISFSLPVILHGAGEILTALIGMSKVKMEDDQIKATVGTAIGKYLQDAKRSGRINSQQITKLSQEAQAANTGGNQNELA